MGAAADYPPGTVFGDVAGKFVMLKVEWAPGESVWCQTDLSMRMDDETVDSLLGHGVADGFTQVLRTGLPVRTP